MSALFDIQGDFEAISAWCQGKLPDFPSVPNTWNADGDLSLYWTAPGRWLLRAPQNQEDALRAATRPGEAPVDISIVEVSDTLQFFAVTGPEAGDIISVASPVDHHPDAFPENGVTYTDIFGIKGLLIRCDDGFELAVERSFGDMIEDFLARTCQ